MTAEKIIKALNKYIAFYERDHVPERFPADEQMPTENGAYMHALWMCREAKTFAVKNPEKAMRWLCFVQGVLWAVGGWTIDEFKDDNR